MANIKLNPVRYYDYTDIYEFSVDNRPIYDVSSNIDLINNSLSDLGYYKDMLANPETEPPGGFSPMTVAYVGDNSRLYPIDITLSPIIIDYTKYPLYLVIKNKGNSSYDCLTFSSTYSITGSYVKFLPSSIGRALKVGPGGSLVDEIYFDLYYSDQQYQNIVVGKVLTISSISFGGNQVSVLSDNRFLAKNRDDNTTGIITKYADNSYSTIANRTVLVNTINSAYPFIEFNAFVGTSNILGSPQPVPIYFSSTGLATNTLTGAFLDSNISSLLNEVHFGSPSVISGATYDPKYSTAGVNIGSLLDYSNTFILHNSALSSLLKETNQTLGTFLTIDPSTNLSASLLLPTISNDNPAVPGTGFGHSVGTSGLPISFFSSIAGKESGIQFGTYSSGIGGFLGYIKDTTILTQEEIASLTASDSASVLYATNKTLVDLASGTHVILNNKNTTSNAGIFISSDYLVLTATEALLNSTISTTSKATSLVNKLYVDTTVNAIASAARSKIPLVGNDSTTPVTGTLFFDISGNASDSSTILDCTTIGNTLLKSTGAFEFVISGTSESFQIIRAATPAANLTAYATDNDVVTRGWVNAQGFATTTSSVNYVTINDAQTIPGAKTFSTMVVLTGPTGLTLQPSSSSVPASITTSRDTVSITSLDGATKVKLDIATPINTDADSIAATKGYVDSAVAGTAPVELMYASWFYQPVNTAIKITTGGQAFTTDQPNGFYYSCIPSPSPDDSAVFSTYFTWNVDGSLTFSAPGYTSTPAIFMATCQDGRWTSNGWSYTGGIFKTQTKIGIKRNGSSSILIVAANIHQDDTDGSSVNTLVGTSCSACVALHTGDILFMGSENSDHVSASLVRIR